MVLEKVYSAPIRGRSSSSINCMVKSPLIGRYLPRLPNYIGGPGPQKMSLTPLVIFKHLKKLNFFLNLKLISLRKI